MTLLSVEKVTKNFAGLCANSNVNMEIGKGELVGLIGPNGAGKTTLFNMLTGVYKPSEGEIKLHKDDEVIAIQGLKPYTITRLGLARTFQNIRLFKQMSVLENVLVAMNKDVSYHLFDALFRSKKYYEGEANMKQEALKLLAIFHLDEKANELACNLSYGQQRRLEMARAMACKPKLLFLDEPAAGMNPQETLELMEMIRYLRDTFDLSILLIEHDMQFVMNLCERIYVLDYGKIIAHGKPEEIKTNKRVIEAYLGEEA